MSYQDSYNAKPTHALDPYGNPVAQHHAANLDQYGNPVVQHHAAAGGGQFQPSNANPAHEYDQYGNPVAKHHATVGGGQFQPSKHADDHIGRGQGGVTSALHRSGSSSSSSSEDDGQGGRRKKGMKDKIKEKLPGQGHKDDQQYPANPTVTQYPANPTVTQYHANTTATPLGGEEKKPGMMEKIKEKIPGGNKH